MNTFFRAVKERGDFWRNGLTGEVKSAFIRNDIDINPTFKDEYKMTLCEKVSGPTRRFLQK